MDTRNNAHYEKEGPSMRVHISYFGHYGLEFKKRSETIQLSQEAPLVDLLRKLAERYGETFKIYVFDPSKPAVNQNVLLTVNDTSFRRLQGLDTLLNNGDRIAFMPLFSGGG